MLSACSLKEKLLDQLFNLLQAKYSISISIGVDRVNCLKIDEGTSWIYDKARKLCLNQCNLFWFIYFNLNRESI